MKILEALKQFDKDNDAHWTADGLPRLDHLKELTGALITRTELLEVAKGFNRFNTNLDTVDSNGEATKDTEGDGDDDANTINDSTELNANGDAGDDGNVVNDRNLEIEKRYHKAQKNKQLADAELASARDAYDEVIKHREAAKNATPFHSLVKQYQASQLKQREAKVKRAEELKLQMASLDAEEKALLGVKL